MTSPSVTIRDLLNRSRQAHMRLRDHYHIARGRLFEDDVRRWLLAQLGAQAQEVQLAIGKYLRSEHTVLDQWVQFAPDEVTRLDDVLEALHEDLDPDGLIALGAGASAALMRLHEQLASTAGCGPAQRELFVDLAELTLHHARQRSRYLLDHDTGRPDTPPR